jgi:hypothetical protein
MTDVHWKLTEMERACRSLHWDCPGTYLEEHRNIGENFLHDRTSPAPHFKPGLSITEEDTPKFYSSNNYSQNIIIPPIKTKRFTENQWRNNNTNYWILGRTECSSQVSKNRNRFTIDFTQKTNPWSREKSVCTLAVAWNDDTQTTNARFGDIYVS